jgi:hypothetical protein
VFGWRDLADLVVDASVVEPVEIFEGREARDLRGSSPSEQSR